MDQVVSSLPDDKKRRLLELLRKKAAATIPDYVPAQGGGVTMESAPVNVPRETRAPLTGGLPHIDLRRVDAALGSKLPSDLSQSPRLFESDALEHGRRILGNAALGLQKIPAMMGGALYNDPIGTAKEMLQFLPNLAQRVNTAVGPSRIAPEREAMYPLGSTPDPTPQEVTRAREELYQNPEEVLIAALPLLKGAATRLAGKSPKFTGAPRSMSERPPTPTQTGGTNTMSFLSANPDVAVALGENVVKGIEWAGGKITPPVLKQARNRVSLPESKRLFRQIEHADELHHRRSGQAQESLKQLGFKKLSNKQGVELADAIEAGKAPQYKKILDTLYFKGRAKGLDFGYRKNYFPRVWKQEIVERAFDDLNGLVRDLGAGTKSDAAVAAALKKSSKQTQDIIGHIIQTKQAKSYSGAVRRLEQSAARELFPEASFEKHRGLELPSWVYERNAKKVLPQYVDAITKRIAEIETWGKDGKKARGLLRLIDDQNPAEGKIANRVLDMWSGQYERHHGLRGTARKAVDAYMGFESATKIGLGTATIPNITQPLISTIPELGVYHFIRGGLDLLTPEGRSFVRQTGVLRESMIQAFTGQQPKGFFGKAAKGTLEVTGFMAVNRGNLYTAASAMQRALPAWHKLAQGSGPRARWAKKRLGDFGVDPSQPLSKNTLLEKSYRFAVDSQLQKNVLKDPLVYNNPIFRPLVLFKRFGGRQAMLSKDMLWREVKRGNPMPMLRLAAGGFLGGELVIWAKNRIREALTGEPQYRKEDLVSWERVINNIAAVGSFGVVSDLADIDGLSSMFGGRDDYASREEIEAPKKFAQKVGFAIQPVFMSDAERIGEAFTNVSRDWIKYDDPGLALRRNASTMAALFGSLPRYASQRLTTTQQKEGRNKFYRGRERTAIMDLIIEGRGKEASRRLQLWNKHRPDNPIIFFEDITLKEIRERVVDREKEKIKAAQ